MKTTHKLRQAQQPYHNTVKIQSCKKWHKTVSFYSMNNPMKKDRQFAVKSDVQRPVSGVSVVISMRKTLHTRFRQKT